jgi:hypothetical protein
LALAAAVVALSGCGSGPKVAPVSGRITLGGKPLAVAIASRPADGSHGTGTRDLTRIARWLVAHADTRVVPARPRC